MRPFTACTIIAALVAKVCQAANRDYYVRAEEVIHDYGPSGRDLMTGQLFDGHEDADIFMFNRPASHQIGRRYWKCRYFEYTDGTFTVQKPRPPWMGMLGPTLRAEVGDRMAVTFQNNCSKAMTMHPHGVKYTKAFEGAPYWDGNDGRGDHVLPGETYTYLWVADEGSGPGPDDGSSIAWLYHSHNPSEMDSNSGLVGSIVITRRGDATAEATPTDVDQEFVLYLSVVDESKSYLLDRNIKQFVEDLSSPLTEAQREALKEDEDFLEGNLMHGINGLLYGNLRGINMPAGQRVRWYVFALGTEADLHFMHWKGHTVLYRGQRTSGMQLMAGVSSVADMLPTEAGEWGMYCHTNDHIVGGMVSTYTVQAPSVPVQTNGRLREHFIQAEEVIWDYGPSGNTLYGTALATDEESAPFFERGGGAQRIGGRYWKCVYKGYTDASFTTEAPRPAKWEHLGFLGPPIHAEVGDNITIVFRNRCTKDVSINVPAVLKPKQHEGWHYGEGSTAAGSGVVAPGATYTYEWQVAEGPGPLDLSSIGFVYASHAPMPTDTNSGLIGPLIITAFGSANEAGEPLEVEDEIVILMSVFNEGESYLLDKNINDFVGGSMTPEEIEALKADADFEESNLMHGINGYLYGNMPPPQLTAGKKVRVYGMAVGTEVDMHSVRITGHSLLIRGERRAQLNLMPGEVFEADMLPTAGTWAVYCQTNDHLSGGMVGRIAVAANPQDDPMLVRGWPGRVRRYYIQAEEVVWDYGNLGHDTTGRYQYMSGDYSNATQRSHTAFEDGDGHVFMINNPENNRIGRQYLKCLFVGYNADFTQAENRSEGSKWQHLGALGPIIHAEEGDTVIIELRNRCAIPVSMHAQIARMAKENEGYNYQEADGSDNQESSVVQPNGQRTLTWQIKEGPGPRDGSSIGTLYYSMANRMVADTYTGLKGPLVITRRGMANADGSPKDVATEFALVFEVTDEGSSLYLDQNFERFVQQRRGTPLTEAEKAAVFEDEDFQESNLMHGINGMMYANLRGLVALAETKVRWYLLGLGTEVDMHSVHWHGHTVTFGGHTLDVVQDMPATGVTADMYADHVGKWLVHCHVNDHITGGMIATYRVAENQERGEAQISTCQQMYGRAADDRREGFDYDSSWFEGHPFQQELSPYYRLAYTVNYTAQYFDMVIAARTTGWLGIGFYGVDESKDHAMIDTDMLTARVTEAGVMVEDRFAQGLETPKQDSTLGGSDQLLMKEGYQANGVTYVRFRRSFRPEDLDEYDYSFGAELEQVKVVYAYSSINSDNLVYHGPTRGFSQIPWNMNCSSNFFFNMQTSMCEACDRGHYRVASDSQFSLTRCYRCPLGTFADVRGGSRATEECEPCACAHTSTLYPGSSSVSDCVCQAGYYHPCTGDDCLTRHNTRSQMQGQMFCLSCPPGMTCKGGVDDIAVADHRHTQPAVPYGHHASLADRSVFKCYGGAGRCPGGDIGTCATGRMGVQCGVCQNGMKAADDYTCVLCQQSDVLPIVICGIVLLLILILAYHLIDNEDRSKQQHSILLAGISSSQLFTLVQMMGAVSMMSVDWPEQLHWLLSFTRIFVFDIEFLNLECAHHFGPVDLFIAKVGLVLALILVMVLIHVVSVLALHHGRFRQKSSSLVAALGTVFMVFFISTVSTLLAPLQCIKHPNDRWTVRAYPTVVCWEGGEHDYMLAVAFVGLLIPLSFVLTALWAVLKYPERMKNGDTKFLKGVGFLIIRFRTDTYWYALFYLGRNLLVSVLPTVPDITIQTLGIQATLIASLCLSMLLKPWRVWQANVLDNAVIIALLLLINLAAFYVEGASTETMVFICIGIIILVTLSIPALVAWAVYLKFRGNMQKEYRFFVCHHKGASGSLARLVKMSLEVHGKRTFIDCDDLTDLDSLFDTVATRTETLIVLCSKDIFLRPWCVGEICTSRTHKLGLVKVVLPDFGNPSLEWIQQYGDHVQDLSVLTSRGLTLTTVQETLVWMRSRPSVVLPGNVTKHSIEGLVQTLMLTGHADEHHLSSKPDIQPETECYVIVDHSNIEAIATGHVLCMLLKPYFVHDIDNLPCVLPRGQEWPVQGRKMMLICTNGCLQQASVMEAIQKASEQAVEHLPILADENFRFPAKGQFLSENYHMLCSLNEAAPQDLEQLVLAIFLEICVSFQPMQASEMMLKAAAVSVYRRIFKGKRLSFASVQSSYDSQASQDSRINEANKLKAEQLKVLDSNGVEVEMDRQDSDEEFRL